MALSWAKNRGLSLATSVQRFMPLSSSSLKKPDDVPEIPGPKAYPVIGCLPSLLSDKEFDKTRIYLHFQKLFRMYGPIVKVRFPGQRPLVLLLNPDDARTVFHLTRKNPTRCSMLSVKKAKYNNPYFEKKGGIVVEDGEEWWRVRSKVQVTVMKPRNVAAYVNDMDQITLDFLQRVARERDATGEVTLDFLEELRRWSLEEICLVSLNQRIGCFSDQEHISPQTQEIMMAAQQYIDSIMTCETGSQLWKVFPTKPFRQIEKSLATLTEVCDKALQEAELKLGNTKNHISQENLNLMDHLLLSGKGLSKKDIVTFMVDIIPGGASTTSDNAAVILYLLAKNPSAQRKLQAELDDVLGDGEGPITAKHLAKLSYCRAVLKEANRVMPPMFGPIRILQEDTKLRDYTLKKGWSVLMTQGLLCWEESEFPRADEFIPDRWLRKRPMGYINPFINIPFSYGTRMCIGRRLAEQNIYILLARVFHRYNVEWKHEDMVRDHKFVFSPRGPLKFTLRERR